MTKAELINAIADKAGLTKKDADAALKAVVCLRLQRGEMCRL